MFHSASQPLAAAPDSPLIQAIFPRILYLSHPPIQVFDHYTGKILLFIDHRRILLSLHELSLPCDLVFAAMFFHSQRSRRPPPQLPRYMRLQFPPFQLQRFLRGCVLATAHALAMPHASVSRLVHARTKSRWIERIFVRVMSGFVEKAKVRRQGVRSAYDAALARLQHFSSAQFKRSHGVAMISLTHSAANEGGYPGTITGDAAAVATPPIAVLLKFHAHTLLLCRLPPPPALQTKTASMKRQGEATSLPCKII
jgi:hypothetical protein